MEDFVSVIIPTYNGEKFILETINSVINQSHANFEIIVVIDGSNDNTESIIRDIDSRISIIKQANGGIGGARNTGLSHANGEYVCFLDHDDVWHKEKLKIQIDIFNRHTDVGVVYGEFSRWHGGDYNFPLEHLSGVECVEELSGWIYHRLLETNYVLFTTATFRKAAIDKVGTFDVKLPPADDWDLNIRLSQITKFYKHNDVVALYRIHEGQTSQKLQSINYESDFRKYCMDRFGTASQDGTEANMKELQKRFFQSDFDFAYSLYRAREFFLASKHFLALTKRKPLLLKLYMLFFVSFFKSIISK